MSQNRMEMLAPIALPETQEFMHRDYAKLGSGLCFITKTKNIPEFQPAIDRGVIWDGDVVTELIGDYWVSCNGTKMFKEKPDQGRHVLIKIEWAVARDTRGTTVDLIAEPYVFRMRRAIPDGTSGVTYLIFSKTWRSVDSNPPHRGDIGGSQTREARLKQGNGRIFL